MQRRSLIWIVAALACAACGESHSENDASAAPSPEPSGSAQPKDPLDLKHPNRRPPPSKPRGLDADETAWAAEEDFTIEFERTACYGTCPTFTLSVQASGDVRFVGTHYVKPGTYDLQVSRDDAARLYRDLIARGFLQLHDSYDVGDAVCLTGVSDSTTSNFTLRAGEREKRIKYYQGCEVDPHDSDALYAIEREIFLVTGLARFLRPKLEPGCGFRFPDFQKTFTASYVLRVDDMPIGIFEVAPTTSDRIPWSVTSCDGTRLAQGSSVARWDCGYLLVPEAETALDWPGAGGPQNAIVIAARDWSSAEASDIVVTLVTLEAETQQRATRGTSCD